MKKDAPNSCFKIWILPQDFIISVVLESLLGTWVHALVAKFLRTNLGESK